MCAVKILASASLEKLPKRSSGVIVREIARHEVRSLTRLLFVLALAACARPAPTVRPVNIHTTIAPMRCALPELGPAAMLVGFPAGAPGVLDLMLTKTDGQALRRELDALREWVAAAAKCMAVNGDP